MAAYRPSLRALLAVGILASWGGTLTWLGLRQMEGGENAELSLLASRQLAPGEARFAVFLGGVQIGSAGITLDTLSPGYRIIETLTLETRGDTGLDRAVRWTETTLEPDLSLRDVSGRFVKLAQRHEGVARYADGRLTMRLTDGGGSVMLASDTQDPPLPLVAVPYQIALRGQLTPGSRTTAIAFAGWPIAGRRVAWVVGAESLAVFPDSATFDTTAMRWKPAHLDTARVYAVEIHAPSGPYTVWIERTGTLAGIEYPLGTRWVRTDFNIAVSDFRRTLRAGAGALRRALPVIQPLATSAVRIDTGTGARRYVVARASGRPIRQGALDAISGGRQRVLADTIVVRDTPYGWTSPSPTIATRPMDPLVPTDAGVIRRFVDSMPQGSASSLMARLVGHIHARVAVDTSYGAATDALGALRARSGRPDGIARLFVAAADALGLRARLAIGFAMSGDTVLTHAWAEVWSPEHNDWVAVDPVLGQAQASTSLIRLGFVGSSHPEDLLTALGDVRLTPIDAVREP